MLAPALDDPSLLEPLCPGRPDIAAQALLRARRSEWAVTDDDVLRRRTTAWLAGPDAQAGTAVRSSRSRAVASTSSDSVSGSITTP